MPTPKHLHLLQYITSSHRKALSLFLTESVFQPFAKRDVIFGAAPAAQPTGTRGVSHAGGLWQCSTSGTFTAHQLPLSFLVPFTFPHVRRDD
jgi:hypothetical protein